MKSVGKKTMGLSAFLVTVVTLFVAGYLYVKKKFQYWEERGVPYVKPEFPYGNLKGIGTTKHTTDIFPKIYKQFKGKVLFGGMYYFTEPVAIAVDLELIKNIFIRDYQYFADRGLYMNEKDDPLSGHIFALTGQRWKNLRNKFSPTFSSGKIKMMQETINAVAKELQNYLEPIAQRSEVVEIKDIMSRFTIDVIGSCAFGVECNSLKNPNAEFKRIGKRVFDYSGLEFLRAYFLTMFPNLGRALRMKFNKEDVSEFFMRILRETTEYREKNNIKRNDFLSLLMQIMKTGKLEGDDTELGKLTFNELAAQTFIFFVAGYETSSSAMTFALYELAQHQDIQDRARTEVQKILEKYNGEFTYDACMEMNYIDQVINESMRKHPIGDNLIRICIKDYNVPGTKHVIEKGTTVMVPVYGIHHDPQIYPDPEKFDPDRFTEENIKNRHPCAWLPFGEGPRNCIGMRFGMMQTRVGLGHVLTKYRVKTSPKTQIPYVADPHINVLSSKGGMWLKLEKI
ncbi:probable cytochrome P450 6a23 [Lutzomyia longipalpis]|uniref:probable cytochrome P450 6a23 n=1 Tax=Lutzomyia longipalpis TaxID=7200 RepID=UPI002483E1A0|nr:probable cytochrome P450 6a23 [Lutzomyia longipalpis]